MADIILRDPNRAVEMSIAAISEAADVSEPTVARFCKSLGFSGLKEFKLRLARSLGAGTPFVHQDVKPGDDASAVVGKMLDRASTALARLSEELDSGLLAKAAKAIAEAPRSNSTGRAIPASWPWMPSTSSSASAFPRRPIPIPMCMPCPPLARPEGCGDRDSASGRTLDLIRSVEIARNVGATVIGLTTRARHSPSSAMSRSPRMSRRIRMSIRRCSPAMCISRSLMS